MVLSPTSLLDALHPVGVVVVHFFLGELCHRLDVTDFGNVTGSVAEQRVEVFLFQQHGVLVAIEQLDALGLVGARETVAVGDLRLAACTALRLNLDDTIGTLRTPDSCSSGIFQYGDALNVLGVDVQQLGELLVVGSRDVEVRLVALPDVAIDDDEGFAGTIDTRHTTQAHRRARTQVTAVGHDVQTGDTTLQGLVYGGDGQTLKLLRRDGLTSGGDFLLRHSQARALGAALGHDLDGLERRLVLHVYTIGGAFDRQYLRGVAHVRDLQFVLRILNLEREVTVHVGRSGGNDTVGGVNLHHVGHHHRAELVGHCTADDVASLLSIAY